VRLFTIVLPIVLLVLGRADARQVIVRVHARDYEQLRRHITFKGTTIEIAGAIPGESYDLLLDESELGLVRSSGLANEVVVPDLGEAKRQAMVDGSYQSYDSIVRVLRNLCASYPSVCVMDSIGQTYENRWIYGIKISDNPTVDEDEPEVLYVGMHHAREWATPQVCRHMADTLVRNYSTNAEFQSFIDSHELWIFPVVNVDGYVYDYPAQRWWRKDRQPFGGSYGCDPNRDYNGCCNGNRMADWGSLVNGSSTSHMPSSEVFFGASGAWGGEIYDLSEFFKRHTFVAVISYHSYSELVLWPYGHGELAPDSAYFRTLGQGIASQIQRLGGGYYTPEQSNYLYPTNCGSDDWMYGWAHYLGGFPCMSYTVEVGTAFYQSTSQLDAIQTQNFKGAWYEMRRSDSIIAALHGAVPRPILAPMDTASSSGFSLHWTPTRPAFNDPDRWELEELTGLAVVTDSFEGGFGRWDTMGATLSTAQRHSGGYSMSLGNGDNVANYIVTKDPAPVQAGDSLRYWIWYNTENNYDVVTTEVSLEGKEWFQLHDRYTGSSGGWLRKAYSLAPWAGKSVFIRFRYVTDDNTLGTGVYIDDVSPVPTFASRTTISSTITDTLYTFASKTPGRYFYRVCGHNAAWGWNDKGPLEDVVVVGPDVGTVALTSPTGTIDSGTAVTPACTVYNYGVTSQSYDVRMRIGSTYDTVAAVNGHAPGERRYVTFPDWTAGLRGGYVVRCSTELEGDVEPGNDAMACTVQVRVRDVGCTRIVAPSGAVDSGTAVTPACTLFNYGTAAESYQVRMRIGAGYDLTAGVAGHSPGAAVYLTFPDWTTGGRGSYVVRCSTELGGDMVASNNLKVCTVQVRVRDVACAYIVAPSGTVDSGMAVTPACTAHNYGTTTEAYQVRMRVGAFYNMTAAVTAHAPGTPAYVTFPAWNVTQIGAHAVTCSTELDGDIVAGNNRQTGTVDVRRPPLHDVGCVTLVAPGGSVDSGASVVPACTVYNYGNSTETYSVRMKVGSTFDQAVDVTSHAPGTRRYVTFPSWTAGLRGNHAVGCSTELAGDGSPDNDRAAGSVVVRVTDAAAAAILAPSGVVPRGQLVLPRVRLRNPGSVTAGLSVRFTITGSSPAYDTTETGITLAAGESLDYGFTRAWTATPAGSYATQAYTILAGDQVPGNDTARGGFMVPAGIAGWQERQPVPDAPSARQVKDGGWLAYDNGTGLVYAAKGNKAPDFYGYDPASDSWQRLALIPDGREAKKPSKGAVACTDGFGTVYATKGNNTQGFYKYDAAKDSWHQLKDVPLGTTHKKVKGGTDIAFVPGAKGPDNVYLLKGYKNEFWRYNPGADSWLELAPAPAPKWDKGSWLVLGPEPRPQLYAHQAKYHGMYAYDLASGSWGAPLHGMPFIGRSGRTRKSKDGGSGAWLGGSVYALKGGNTQEFWRYGPAKDSWDELDTMPQYGSAGRRKKVKSGADITATADALFALKGNKTNELWRYVPAAEGGVLNTEYRGGVMATPFAVCRSPFAIAPNPIRAGFATLSLSGPAAQRSSGRMVRISLCDVSGRVVLHQALSVRREASSVHLDLRSMSAGVYLVELTSGSYTAFSKFIVQR
jgi:hypothetical protein